MLRLIAALGLSLTLFFAPQQAAAQLFDPRDYRGQIAGEPTQIMVLGTAHLSGAPDGWNPAVLDPLLDRLAAFDPDVITTEDQPGPVIVKLWQYRALFPETAATYAGRAMRMATEAGLSLDMDMPQAAFARSRMMAEWPDNPTPDDRRHLATLFAASGDPHSALVQWWRLPEAQRIAKGPVSSRLADQLDDLGQSADESVLIAVRLAARLGLERIYPVDSQDDATFERDLFAETVFPALVRDFEADPILQDGGSISKMVDGDTVLAEYRKLNSPTVRRRSADIEWLGAIDQPTEQDVGRKRMAGWDVRNMRMAANIREASARAPGGRVLVLVGAAHKIWLEAYLDRMADVDIVSTDNVLR